METKTYRVTVTLDPSNIIDVVATSWNIDNDNMLFFYIDKKIVAVFAPGGWKFVQLVEE